MNRCVTDNGLPVYHIDYEIRMNYEFLEDIYADWFSGLLSGSGGGSEVDSVHSFHLDKSELGFAMIDGQQDKEWATKQLEKKSNHPLMVMVGYQRSCHQNKLFLSLYYRHNHHHHCRHHHHRHHNHHHCRHHQHRRRHRHHHRYHHHHRRRRRYRLVQSIREYFILPEMISILFRCIFSYSRLKVNERI